MRTCFVDVETTGLDESIHDLLEVGAVLYDAEGVELRRWAAKVSVEPSALSSACAEALRVNGYSAERWRDARPLGEVLTELTELLAVSDVVGGHNVAFDLRFLRSAYAKAGLEWPWRGYRCVDVRDFAWAAGRPVTGSVVAGTGLPAEAACAEQQGSLDSMSFAWAAAGSAGGMSLAKAVAAFGLGGSCRADHTALNDALASASVAWKASALIRRGLAGYTPGKFGELLAELEGARAGRDAALEALVALSRAENAASEKSDKGQK